MIVATGIGGGAWWLSRDSVAQPNEPGSVVVEAIPTTVTSYGIEQPDGSIVGDVLAGELSAISGLRVGSPVDPKTASDNPRWLVRGTIREAKTMDATLQLVDLATGGLTPITVTVSTTALAPLLAEVARQIATTIHPDMTTTRDPARVHDWFEAGTAAADKYLWTTARIYFEQTVQTDPTLAKAWPALASARGWSNAPQRLIEEALDQAIALSDDDRRRTIWSGVRSVYRENYRQAIAILAPLEADPTFTGDDRRNILMYLGEAYFHDGSYTTGIGYFKQLLEGVPYRPAAIHVVEHAMVHRDIAAIEHFGADRSVLAIRFARGDYEALVAAKTAPYELHASIVLEREPAASAVAAADSRAVAIWRYARATAPDEVTNTFEVAWKNVAPLGPNIAFDEFRAVIEVALTSERVDHVRRILTHLEQTSSEIRDGGRYRILAAAFLGQGRSLAHGDRRTTRENTLANAIEAELAGDRARAVTLLEQLIVDPGVRWDIPERAALIRNYHALGRKQQLADICTKSRYPPVFHYAWIPLRRSCVKLATAR